MREKINRVILNCKNKQFGIGSVTTDQLKQGTDIWGTFTIEQSQKSSSWRELYSSVELLEVVVSLLPGCIVPLYLDSQVAVMNLGGDILGLSTREKSLEVPKKRISKTSYPNFQS